MNFPHTNPRIGTFIQHRSSRKLERISFNAFCMDFLVFCKVVTRSECCFEATRGVYFLGIATNHNLGFLCDVKINSESRSDSGSIG